MSRMVVRCSGLWGNKGLFRNQQVKWNAKQAL